MDDEQYQYPNTETQLLEETVKAIHAYDVDRIVDLRQIADGWSQMENERKAQIKLLIAIETLLDMALNQ